MAFDLEKLKNVKKEKELNNQEKAQELLNEINSIYNIFEYYIESENFEDRLQQQLEYCIETNKNYCSLCLFFSNDYENLVLQIGFNSYSLIFTENISSYEILYAKTDMFINAYIQMLYKCDEKLIEKIKSLGLSCTGFFNKKGITKNDILDESLTFYAKIQLKDI